MRNHHDITSITINSQYSGYERAYKYYYYTWYYPMVIMNYPMIWLTISNQYYYYKTPGKPYFQEILAHYQEIFESQRSLRSSVRQRWEMLGGPGGPERSDLVGRLMRSLLFKAHKNCGRSLTHSIPWEIHGVKRLLMFAHGVALPSYERKQPCREPLISTYLRRFLWIGFMNTYMISNLTCFSYSIDIQLGI